jgi:ligand-binding sensor domain-containing protein
VALKLQFPVEEPANLLKKLKPIQTSAVINKRFRIAFFTFCLTWLCAAVSLQTRAQDVFIQHYTTKEGLPSNNCYFSLQDSKGYIWFGTDAGVSRFDGKTFENFSIDDGLPDNQILQIKEDKKGRIWFIAFNGEMSYFLDGIIYNSKNDKTLRALKFNAIVISMYQDSKDRLWFGTNKNILYMFDGETLTKFTSTDLNNQFIFTYVNEDAKGRIWTYSKQCLRIYKNGRFKLYPHASLNPLSYKTIMNLPENALLYIDSAGLNYRKGTTNKTLNKIGAALQQENLGYFYANEKELWLSHKNGVYQQDAHGKVTNYLQGVPTVQVIKDKDKNMWFTTSEGIYMLSKVEKRIYMMNKTHGLSSNVVKSIYKDQNKNIWLGLDGGYLNRVAYKSHKVDQIEIPDKKIFGTGPKKLVLDRANGSLFFASDYGLGVLSNVYNQKKDIRYLKEINNSFLVVKDFSIDRKGGLSLAMSSGVAMLNDRNKSLLFDMQHLKEGVNFFSDRSYSVFYDKNGNLWFSNINGLNELSKGKIKKYVKNSLLTRRINDINQLPDGTMVMATDGYGLILIKDNKIRHHFTMENGLASNICKKIFISNNDIWVITNEGINRICMDLEKPVVNAFEYTNALLKNDVNDLFVDSATSYFATNTGMVYFRHKPHQGPEDKPEALISSIIVNDQKISLKDSSIVLTPARNKIAFYFGAIDFQGQDLAFRYRLKPADEWTNTPNRRVGANSLPPGKYLFEVSAKTKNSDWGPSVSVKFEQEANFWQTTWFMLLLFAIAAITFYGIAVVVTKKQKDKEQQKLLLKNQILMLEQKALQAMMNPHFVFNILNSIQHYINTKDTSSANKVLTGFARLIRKNMEICTKSYVSLEEELEYLMLYLTLEKKRFGEKLRYEIQVDPQIDKEETFIPSMLLQPYIENAIWHGIMPLEAGGDLKISILLENQHRLKIEITDNGIGIDNSLKQKKNEHTSKGMTLTQERINLLNMIEANPIQIKVQQNGTFGTSVLIFIYLS